MKHSAIFAALLVIGMAAAESIRGQVLDYSQLVSLWRLTGDSADSYGTNNGVMVGDAVFDAGPLAEMGSAVFAGTNYVKAGKGVAFETNIAFTATAWVKGPAQNSAIMGRMDQGGSYTGWEFHVGDRAGLLNVWLINQYGSNYIEVYGGTPILDENWHHVCFSYDGSGTAAGVRIYVDGQDDTSEAGADTLTGTMVATKAELNLGSRQNGANHTWQGNLSEISLWKTVLTPLQITAIYQDGIHPPMTFAASANEVFAGMPVTLAWEAESGAALSIDQGVGDVTGISVNGKGSKQVSPEVETTYTLTAKKGTITQSKKVTISMKPLIVQFASSGTNVPRDVPVALSWIVHPQAQLTMKPAVGDLAIHTTNGVGMTELIPDQTTVFTLNAVRGAEKAESSLTVTIIETGVPDFSKLVSLWRLNDNTMDSIGTNNATFFGPSEEYLDGPRTNSRAILLDGSSFVSAGTGVAFDTAMPFSAVAWVNGPLAQDSTIIGRMRQGNGYAGWELHVGTDAGGSEAGKLNVWLINGFGPSYIQVNSPAIVMDESWHHVAFTYDGSSKAAGVKIYVDGQDSTGEATADNLSATILAEDAELNLGSRQNGSAHVYQGSISEASVWQTVLTPGNIAYLYKTGIPVTLPTPDIRLSGFRFTPPTTFSFAWVSVVGKSYRVETSSNLKDWSATADNYPTGGATSTSTTFSEAVASNAAVFYRVLQR